MINQVTVMGRLVKDPKLIKTETKKLVCYFNIAVNVVKGTCYYFRCSCWDLVAENLVARGKKGQRVVAIGRLTQRKMKSKLGESIYQIEINCERVEIIDKLTSGNLLSEEEDKDDADVLIEDEEFPF